MTVMRSALLILSLFPAFALGQAMDEEADGKVSNDQPGRPLQMPPASTEVKEAFDDFERFSRRGAWERALKALYTIPEEQALRFVDGEDGFIIPVARKRATVLAALPPEGQAAYRLFYDAEAKKLFEEAEGASELKDLERVYSAYFVSSVGDNAADRLGDLYFELGRFDRAADCWLADPPRPPRHRPLARPDLAQGGPGPVPRGTPVRVRAGPRRAGGPVRRRDGDRRRERPRRPPSSSRASWARRPAATDPARAGAAPRRRGPGPLRPGGRRLAVPLRRLGRGRHDPRRADPVEGQPPQRRRPRRGDRRDEAVRELPRVRLRPGPGEREDALAVRRRSTTSKSPRCRTRPAMLDPSRFAIVASGESRLDASGGTLKDQNYLAPFRLTCRRAEGGEVVWQSTDLPDYAGLDLAGPPLLAGGKLFIAAKSQGNPQQQGQPQQIVLAIQPHDGKVLWKTEVGTFRQGQQYYYYGYREPSPQPQTGPPRGGALRRHPRRRARAARRGVRGARLGLRIPDGPRPGPGPVHLLRRVMPVPGGDDGQQSRRSWPASPS